MMTTATIDTVTTNKLSQTALYYAKSGWHVFPLAPREKTPLASLAPKGVHDATNDQVIVSRWWEQCPDANIGLHCGASGLLVLDFDTDKSDFAGGELLERLRNEYHTTTARSGSGGYHLLYQQPDGDTLGNGRGKLPKGVDVRGQGGYIVVAPSIHPNGNPYTWEVFPVELPPQPLPGFLLDILRPQKSTPAQPVHPNGNGTHPTGNAPTAAELMEMATRQAGADGRNNTGLWLACQLRDNGYTKAEAWNIMRTYQRTVENDKAGDPYTESEAQKTCDSAYSQQPRSPWTPITPYTNGSGAHHVSEPPPWLGVDDVGAVDWVGNDETSEAGAMDDSMNDDEGEETSHPLDVETPPIALGWIDEYADLMTTLTGSPREFNLVCGLVTVATAIQRKARLRMAFADIYPNIYAAIIARSSVYHKSSALHKPRSLMRRALLDRLILSEQMTSEGLLAQLQGQPSGVVIRDEIGTLFGSDKVKYLITLKPDLTALFDCLPYSRRLSNLEIKVDAPYLNILGATTPARFYEAVTSTDWQDGFLARWLFVLPEGEPDFDAMTGLYEEKHDTEIGRLAVTLQNLDRQREQDFILAPDAFTLWDGWQRQAAKDAYYHGDDRIAAVVTRYSAYALKFALILAAVNGEWGTVTSSTMQTAIHLADSFKRSVARLLREKEEYQVSGAKLQKVFKAIQFLNAGGNGVITKKIQQRTGMQAAQLTPCIEKLMEVGAIAQKQAGRGFRYWATTGELPIRTWK
jgi:hypothetical protein